MHPSLSQPLTFLRYQQVPTPEGFGENLILHDWIFRRRTAANMIDSIDLRFCGTIFCCTSANFRGPVQNRSLLPLTQHRFQYMVCPFLFCSCGQLYLHKPPSHEGRPLWTAYFKHVKRMETLGFLSVFAPQNLRLSVLSKGNENHQPPFASDCHRSIVARVSSELSRRATTSAI